MTRPIVYHNRPGQVGKRSFLYAKNCLPDLKWERPAIAENGKDIRAEQGKAEGLKKERDSLQTQLSEANETIKGYKDMGVDAIKKSAGDREDKYKANVK